MASGLMKKTQRFLFLFFVLFCFLNQKKVKYVCNFTHEITVSLTQKRRISRA